MSALADLPRRMLPRRRGRKVRILSDGTPSGTRVEVGGQRIDGIKEVAWSVVHGSPAVAILVVHPEHVNVVGHEQTPHGAALATNPQDKEDPA